MRSALYVVATETLPFIFQIWVEQKVDLSFRTTLRIAACCNSALLLAEQ